MTEQLSKLTGPATREWAEDAAPATADYSPTTGRDLYLLVALDVGVTLLWAFWKAVGVDLRADTGGGAHTVGLASVLVSTTVVVAAAFGLRRLLRRRGLRTWTITAVVIGVVSLLGPTAATKPDAGVALLTFHLLVGAGLIAGVRRLHGTEAMRSASASTAG